MADATKQQQSTTSHQTFLIGGRKAEVLAYVLLVALVACTALIALTVSSPTPSSLPWLDRFVSSTDIIARRSQFLQGNSSSDVNSAKHAADRAMQGFRGGKRRQKKKKKNNKSFGPGGDDQRGSGGLMGCDIYDGKWVKDESYPLYKEGSCPYVHESFDCFGNGRPDLDYQKLRWQPNRCNIPRLNGTDMLERLRGKRLAVAGDSINRNLWDSLICILWKSVKDKSMVFQTTWLRQYHTDGSYSFLFKDYNLSVEFYWAPFLVQEWQTPGLNGTKKETLRLDMVEKRTCTYKNADIIIFNSGHWWTPEKTFFGKDYYEEGGQIYRQLNDDQAFSKAMSTWARWVDANINPKETLVFFRGYSGTHFSGGKWNAGGACHKETQPIVREAHMPDYPKKMKILEAVLGDMKTPVSYMNVTRMTDYRKDAHPSIYRKRNRTEAERKAPERYQDCSHWCLPGLPDFWIELLYTELLLKLQ